MIGGDFKAKWSGSPLIRVSVGAIGEAEVAPEDRAFLTEVGLPSDALWFVKHNSGTMSFAETERLKTLSVAEVGESIREKVVSLGSLRCLGTYRSLLIAMDSSGQVWMISDSNNSGKSLEQHVVFVNRSPRRFADCLVAYKELHEFVDQNGFGLSHQEIQAAIERCRVVIERIDSMALAGEDNYWAQVLDRIWG